MINPKNLKAFFSQPKAGSVKLPAMKVRGVSSTGDASLKQSLREGKMLSAHPMPARAAPKQAPKPAAPPAKKPDPLRNYSVGVHRADPAFGRSAFPSKTSARPTRSENLAFARNATVRGVRPADPTSRIPGTHRGRIIDVSNKTRAAEAAAGRALPTRSFGEPSGVFPASPITDRPPRRPEPVFTGPLRSAPQSHKPNFTKPMSTSAAANKAAKFQVDQRERLRNLEETKRNAAKNWAHLPPKIREQNMRLLEREIADARRKAAALK